MDKSSIQNVDVYLDFATIPTLHYFSHFIQKRQDKESIRLFGLGRFEIPQSIINQYPEGIIRFCSTFAGNQSDFHQLFENLLIEKKNEALHFNFHLNLFHAFDMLQPLLEIMAKYPESRKIFTLHFYDDGSEGLVNLYQIKQRYSRQELQEVVDKNVANFRATPIVMNDLEISRYLWNERIEAHYYFLNDFILTEPVLAPLKEQIKHCHILNWNAYISASNEEKNLFHQLLNIDETRIAQYINNFQNKKVFLFTGTTLFNLEQKDEQWFYLLHVNAILNYIQQAGKWFIGEGFELCIKGHPHQKALNQRLAETFTTAIHLPDSIPFEILYLLGCKPAKIGGFVSTSYFSCEKESFADLIFISCDDKTEREKSLILQQQYILKELMQELDYINPQNTHYYTDIQSIV